jgi:Stabilization of polarity axis
MRLFSGVLRGKRVLLVGVGVRVDVVCRMCLSVAALISPPLPGIISSRVFPFCNFSTWSEVQATPGYLAGTTNPTFLSPSSVHQWDLLADIRTGSVYGPGELPEKSQNLQVGDRLPVVSQRSWRLCETLIRDTVYFLSLSLSLSRVHFLSHSHRWL